MVTAPPPLYAPLGGALCLDFVNSIDRPGSGPPPAEGDLLKSHADLCRWTAEAGCLPPARAQRLASAGRRRAAAAARVLKRARALRETVFRCFRDVAQGGSPRRADLTALNAELAEAMARLRVAPAGAGASACCGWVWDPDPEALEAPLWPIARSAAELLTAPERALVKACASDACLWLFLDRTKNRQRRWCDMRVCGNRAKVREHRRRKKRGG